MNKLLKALTLVVILSLIAINVVPTCIADPETTGIPIKRVYFVAQISGEIILKDPASYKKSLLPDRYKDIQVNGTVVNSTLLNPFSIWPPISIFPGLRMLFLTDDSTVSMTIKSFKGKFYTKDEETKVRFYGMGIGINITANLEI